MRCFSLLLVISVFVFIVHSDTAYCLEQAADTNKTPQPKVERLEIKAPFIVSMISDGNGGVFVGTEDNGVYHYDNALKQYTIKDGLGDNNAYALVIDKLGRLWVGHVNRGVAVFNGEKWKKYDVLHGLIGDRVFDIQTCPVDGDVWIATSAGITRYKVDSDSWEYITRDDGLPEDQVSSIAFKKDGTLIVGTQCHGIAVFNRSGGNYKHHKNITAPERFGIDNRSPVPLVPEGEGLPTNQINQIIVAGDGNIWVATPTGLVRSNGALTKLQYVRGRDYADKVRGLYGGAPKDWKECPNEVKEYLLPEDYITCVAEDATGTIWLGTRRRGFMAIDPKTGRRGTGDRESMGMADNYVSSILPMPDGKPLIGLYIGGVIKPKDELRLNKKDISKQGQKNNSLAKQNFPPLPSTIKTPTIDELNAMQEKVNKINKPLPKVYADLYTEDWETRGDWTGKYGYDFAILCAMQAPFDRNVFVSENYYRVNPFIGPHRTKDDELRYWVHWKETNDERSLWDPLNGCRRQSEWDDHGEAYPLTHDGPDLWTLIDIDHPGVFQVELYFFNKDGHTGNNRLRDYMIEIYPCPEEWQGFDDEERFAKGAESLVSKMPPICKTRVKDFWGGVYKTFIMSGPSKYLVKIDRNYSYNTIVSFVGIKRLLGEPVPDEKFKIPLLQYGDYRMTDKNLGIAGMGKWHKFQHENNALAVSLWNSLDKSLAYKDAVDIQQKARVMAFHVFAENCGAGDHEARYFLEAKFLLNQWDSKFRDRARFECEKAHYILLEKVTGLKASLEKQKGNKNPSDEEKYDFIVIPAVGGRVRE
ncbi:MAG: hypothetical protein LBU65_08850 [Planctomycetaceae bacterium]|nr:hypothetical protein [Planctomycetaceae bacterium]